MKANTNTKILEYPVLIGDIGGTNARFAIVRDGQSSMEMFEPVITDDFPDMQSAIKASVLAKTSSIPKSMVMALAAPIIGDAFQLTNAVWAVRPGEVISELNISQGHFMNDFSAQALGVFAIDQTAMHRVGGGNFQENGTRVVLGPGTSFGIATMVKVSGCWTILPSEGGSADLGLGTGENATRELQIQTHVRKLLSRQSIGGLISGSGLEILYQAICQSDSISEARLSAAKISSSTKSNPAASEAVNLFSALLGRVAGNIALGVFATGGVYITGGMAHKMLDQLAQGDFRREFESKAPQHELAMCIPTWFVNHENAALEGLAHYVGRPEKFDLTHACAKYSA